VKNAENWLTNISSASAAEKCSVFGRVISFQNDEEVKIIRLADISGYCDIIINREFPILEIGHYLFLNDLKSIDSKFLKFSDETKLTNVTLCKAIPNSFFLHDLKPLYNDLQFFYSVAIPTRLISNRIFFDKI
jgi:hypothetical protein